MNRKIAITIAIVGLAALAAVPLVSRQAEKPARGRAPLSLRIPALAVNYLNADVRLDQRITARGGVYDLAVRDVLERCDPSIREIIEPLSAETIADLDRGGRRGLEAERDLLRKAVEVMAACGWDANEGHVVTSDY